VDPGRCLRLDLGLGVQVNLGLYHQQGLGVQVNLGWCHRLDLGLRPRVRTWMAPRPLRVELRIATDEAGEIYILTKSDGLIRRITSIR
jgi:hypothetical protein